MTTAAMSDDIMSGDIISDYYIGATGTVLKDRAIEMARTASSKGRGNMEQSTEFVARLPPPSGVCIVSEEQGYTGIKKKWKDSGRIKKGYSRAPRL